MKLLHRLGYYLFGLSLGLVFLAVVFKGKKTSCNYGPNDRVIHNISNKAWENTLKNNSAFDSISFIHFLKKAQVDFNKSNTQKDSCKTYFINGYWKEKPVTIEIENCKKTARLLQIVDQIE